jgi:membrane-bound ClpP family serine protease
MWFVAGLLLGSVVLASLIGFHTGPHTHVLAGVLGILAAAWLVIMAVEGRSLSVLLLLLSADVVVSGGVGMLAWKGLTTRNLEGLGHHNRLEGAEGVAQNDLHPSGIVRVRGENWSAESMNGDIPAGTRVQVIRVSGVRLHVWGEHSDSDAPDVSQLQEGSA